MGLAPQPDGFTAGLAGHCQLDKKISIDSGRIWSKFYVCFNGNNFTSSAIMLSK